MNFYFSDSGNGSQTGTDPANALAISWANDAAQWSSVPVAGKISPGDTLLLVGKITTSITPKGSGTVGAQITIFFTENASMSRPNWNQSGANGDAAIFIDGYSFITIDGGENGIIEATSNGTSLATQLNNCGVRGDSVTNITCRNLTVQKMYVRTHGPDESGTANCFRFGGVMSDIVIDNCVVSDAVAAIFFGYETAERLSVSNCTGTNTGEGCVVAGSIATGATLAGLIINRNSFETTLQWGGYSDIHKNLVHVYAVHTSSRVDGLQITENRGSGDMGDNSTSFLFAEGFVYAPRIVNNLLTPEAFSGNGLVVIKGNQDAVVLYNTFVGNDSSPIGVGIGTTGFGALGTGLVVKGNAMSGIATGIYDPEEMTSDSDYNLFYPAPQMQYGTGLDTFAGWKAETGFDSHSLTTDPDLSENYSPTNGSPLVAAGTNLTSTFDTDILNRIRPTPATSWCIGAFEGPWTGDSLVLATTTYSGPWTALVSRAAPPEGQPSEQVVQGTNDYPTQVSDCNSAAVLDTGEQILVMTTHCGLAAAQALRDSL